MRAIFGISLLSIGFMAPSLAAEDATFYKRHGIYLPPYEHITGAFIAPPVIVHLSHNDVSEICRSQDFLDLSDSPGTAYACVVFHAGGSPVSWVKRNSADECIIYIALDQVELTRYQDIIDHDLGHCRGWPQDDPR